MPKPKDVLSGGLYVITDQLSGTIVEVAMHLTDRVELILAFAMLIYAFLSWMARFLHRRSDSDGTHTEMETVVLSFVDHLLWIATFGITRIILLSIKNLLLLHPFLAWYEAVAVFVLVALLVFTVATKFAGTADAGYGKQKHREKKQTR